jgi:hypothetical protein
MSQTFQKLPNPTSKAQNTQIYIVRPDLDQIQNVINQIKLQGDAAQDANILFIPNRTIECEELL